MNGRKARYLRKKVYGDEDYRERMYGRSKKSGMIFNLNKGDFKQPPKRAIYQKLKKQ